MSTTEKILQTMNSLTVRGVDRRALLKMFRGQITVYYSPWCAVAARARVGAGVGAAVSQLLVLGHVSGGGH